MLNQLTLFLPTKGEKLIHIRTGRPVEVMEVTDESFAVRTLDDIWAHPKTGKEWGGSRWELDLQSIDEFRRNL